MLEIICFLYICYFEYCLFFFFNDTATTEIYTLSLHDALPIWATKVLSPSATGNHSPGPMPGPRSEEHTSELQSRDNLVCRLLLEKKKINKTNVAAGVASVLVQYCLSDLYNR